MKLKLSERVSEQKDRSEKEFESHGWHSENIQHFSYWNLKKESNKRKKKGEATLGYIMTENFANLTRDTKV